MPRITFKHLSFLLLVFLFSSFKITAQCDTIYLKDGSAIAANIVDVNPVQIKYKRIENTNGPTFVVPVTEVKLVVYKNGRRETFGPAAPVIQASGPIGQKRTREEARKIFEDMGRRYNYNGPRVGAGYYGVGLYSDDILAKGKQPIVSQFGWQFETRVFTAKKSGMAGLVEFIPMIGGMEQGMFIPSGTVAFALRNRNGFEVSIGPTLSTYGLAMAASISTSFRIEDVCFPVSLSFIPSVHKAIAENTWTGKKVYVVSDTGFKIALTIGFNTLRD